MWEKCIREAERQSAELSPIAIAVRDQTGLDCLDFGEYLVIRGRATGDREVTVDLPQNCREFTGRWETGQLVEPFAFMLNTEPSKLFALTGVLR